MTDLKYDKKNREISGTATNLNDWARKCDEFQKTYGIIIDRPGSATVSQKSDGTKEYRLKLPEMKKK